MLQLALLFLGFGNLLCGFAKTPIQLYVFRAISGLGGGGINGIAMTVVSMGLLLDSDVCFMWADEGNDSRVGIGHCFIEGSGQVSRSDQRGEFAGILYRSVCRGRSGFHRAMALGLLVSPLGAPLASDL